MAKPKKSAAAVRSDAEYDAMMNRITDVLLNRIDDLERQVAHLGVAAANSKLDLAALLAEIDEAIDETYVTSPEWAATRKKLVSLAAG